MRQVDEIEPEMDMLWASRGSLIKPIGGIKEIPEYIEEHNHTIQGPYWGETVAEAGIFPLACTGFQRCPLLLWISCRISP